MTKKVDKILTLLNFFENFFNFLYIKKKDIMSACRINIYKGID